MNRKPTKEELADALRRYPTWGHAYVAQQERADVLGRVVRDVWGSLLAYWDDISEAEIRRLIARCESVNRLIDDDSEVERLSDAWSKP